MTTTTTTFTTTAGSPGHTYFQDIEMTPASVKDGSLRLRLDRRRYPGGGVKNVFNPTVTSVTPATTSEAQTITEGGSGLVSYVLHYAGQDTTSLLAAATAAQVQAALEALSNIGAGNVSVAGSASGPYTVSFIGTLANTDVALMTSTPTGGSGTVTVASAGGVAAAYEVALVGTYFGRGVTVSVSGAGVAVTNVRRGSDGDHLMATFTVTGGATPGARDITVTNLDTGAVTSAGVWTIA